MNGIALGTKITTTLYVDPKELPDGEYAGQWGGYVATVDIGGMVYEIETNLGVPTMSCPAVIKIKLGVITVEPYRVSTN